MTEEKTVDEKISDFANKAILVLISRVTIPIIGAMCAGIFGFVYNAHDDITRLITKLDGLNTRVEILEAWRNTTD